jgi:hypothetical protein
LLIKLVLYSTMPVLLRLATRACMPYSWVISDHSGGPGLVHDYGDFAWKKILWPATCPQQLRDIQEYYLEGQISF